VCIGLWIETQALYHFDGHEGYEWSLLSSIGNSSCGCGDLPGVVDDSWGSRHSQPVPRLVVFID
jgi:hypothetical protein